MCAQEVDLVHIPEDVSVEPKNYLFFTEEGTVWACVQCIVVKAAQRVEKMAVG